MKIMSQIEKLICSTQNYPWGKPASTSLVAKFSGKCDEAGPFAELWMGTHPRGHSTLAKTGQKLKDWIEESQNIRMGSTISTTKSGELPFLLKVLSVNKALSLQLHPNLEEAAKLHSAHPDKYPDPNHKPEMAIALTVFEGLCGFRPVKEIIENIKNHDELHANLSTKVLSHIQDEVPILEETSFVKMLFTDLITMKNSAQLISKKLERSKDHSPSDKLFLRIHNQHPGDAGLVCIYLLNHVILQPGECMFLGANKPHAYFSGDCVECMACSDNVIRAGLTGKFIDVDALIRLVECSTNSADAQKLAPIPVDDGIVMKYLPPVKDFAVDKICVKDLYSLPGKVSPQVMLCTNGSGTLKTPESFEEVMPGNVVFVVPYTSVTITGNVTLYSAYAQH